MLLAEISENILNPIIPLGECVRNIKRMNTRGIIFLVSFGDIIPQGVLELARYETMVYGID